MILFTLCCLDVWTLASETYVRKVEVIGLETARRLHFGHGFSFADIDDLECFTPHDECKRRERFMFFPMRLSRGSGLLSDVQQRSVVLSA